MTVITIGRHPNDDVMIDDPMVTRCHLKITQDDNGSYTLVNYGENGTFVSGKIVNGNEETTLFQNDIVRIGNTTLPWQSYFEQKLNSMSEFKQCENGHYYQGEKCSYCRPIDEQLEELGENPKPFPPEPEVVMCYNMSAPPPQKVITIGRSANNDIVINDPCVCG